MSHKYLQFKISSIQINPTPHMSFVPNDDANISDLCREAKDLSDAAQLPVRFTFNGVEVWAQNNLSISEMLNNYFYKRGIR